MFTHGGRFHLFDVGHYEKLQFNARRFGDKKVVLLTRDIRDTLVSSYFQESKRTGVFRGDIGNFVRNPQLGAPKIVSFYNMWFKNRDRTRAFLPVTYEALHEAPSKELRRVLEFLRLQDVNDALLKRAVQYADFGNMRRLETSGRFRDSMMLPGHKDDDESLKVRRGKVGGYADYLDESAQTYIAEVVEALGLPGCDWYFASRDAPSAEA
jgi:hypothetical protein